MQIEKRPTRLAEATFFSFVPNLPATAGKWALTVLGSRMDPTDVLGAVGESYLENVFGGSPHLRGVEAAHWQPAAAEATGAREYTL